VNAIETAVFKFTSKKSVRPKTQNPEKAFPPARKLRASAADADAGGSLLMFQPLARSRLSKLFDTPWPRVVTSTQLEVCQPLCFQGELGSGEPGNFSIREV